MLTNVDKPNHYEMSDFNAGAEEYEEINTNDLKSASFTPYDAKVAQSEPSSPAKCKILVFALR